MALFTVTLTFDLKSRLASVLTFLNSFSNNSKDRVLQFESSTDPCNAKTAGENSVSNEVDVYLNVLRSCVEDRIGC